MSTLPLQDYRILITRGKEQSAGFKAGIEKNGGIPLIVPLIDFQLSTNTEEVAEAFRQLSNYEWIILTSQNGVRFFFELANKYKVTRCIPKIAVIGAKTAKSLERYGYAADFIPKEFVAERFIEEFKPLLQAESRVLVAKGNLARTVIADTLNETGATVDEVIIYETVLPKDSKEQIVRLLREQEVDVITFTSSSTIHHFMKIVEQYKLHPYLESLIIACIGPIAKKTALQHGLQVHVCPGVYTTEAMLNDIITFIQTKGGAPQ